MDHLSWETVVWKTRRGSLADMCPRWMSNVSHVLFGDYCSLAYLKTGHTPVQVLAVPNAYTGQIVASSCIYAFLLYSGVHIGSITLNVYIKDLWCTHLGPRIQGAHQNTQGVKFSADPNSAVFSGFLVIPEIRVNLERKLKGCMGGGRGVPQELLGPQKWFSYQNLQNFTRKCMAVLSELCL